MSEVRALLLTDVVDSTRWSEQVGDAAMAEVWTAHDRLARDLLPRWRGREIDKTDGMLLLFEDASDALQYALAYQRAMATLPLPMQARAGLHVGAVILRENSAEDVARGAKPLEVDGLAKPVTARVMSLARGGQILLTAEAHAAIALPGVALPGVPLQSHGHWQVKGVAAPLELFEAGDAAAAFAAPTDGDKAYRVVRVGERWLPAREIPNNLPPQPTSFIGRERELDDIKACLGSARLVTLLGMGGLGKTRLTLQVAAELMAEFPDGAWFLDLAPIRDPALVVGAAAQVLGVREEPGRRLVDSVRSHLAQRHALLVIDNCEHLLQAAAEFAHAVLNAAPGVRIMASSREVLHVPGEQVVPILPLPVPGRGASLEALSRSTAVRLFVARAQSHKPSFRLDEREAPAVAELVARLEGIPLALELAAARVRALTVSDINRRLADRYQLLTGGSKVLQQRQQTLRALVDWSYELLQPAEQRLFARLGVFAGGFDLAAAEAVCGAAPLDPLDVLDLLTSLVEKSLVLLDESGDEGRYRMLETLRDYARDKLEHGGELAATAAAHAQHYFVFAKAVRVAMNGPEQGLYAARAEADLDNLRAAIALALAGGIDPTIAVKIAVALQNFWLLRGYVSEGRAVVRAALAQPAVQASDLILGHALYVGACLAYSQSDHAEARQQLEASLALRRGLGKAVDIAATLSTLAMTLLMAGDAAAATASETEALRLFEDSGHRHGQAVGHQHLAQFALYLGHDDEAAVQIEHGLRLTRELGYREIEAECLLLRAEWAFEGGQIALARASCAESLEVCESSGDKRGVARARFWLARLALHGAIEGDRAAGLAAARAHLAAALQAFSDFVMRDELLAALEETARLALDGDALPLARSLADAVEQERLRLRLCRDPRSERRWQALLQRLPALAPQAGIDADACARARARADEGTLDAACCAALTLLR